MPVAMTGCCDCGLIILFLLCAIFGLVVALCTGCGCQLLVWRWPWGGLMHRLQMPVACVMLALGWPGVPVADAGCLCVVGLGVA